MAIVYKDYSRMAGQGSGSQRKSVLLDVDGVIAPVHDTMLELYNSDKHTSYTIEDMDDWGFESKIGMSMEEFYRYYNLSWIEHWEEMKPTVSPQDLKDLKEKYDIDIVTNRGSVTEQAFILWYNKNFNGIGCSIFVEPNDLDKTTLPYRIFVEDNPMVASAIQQEDSGRMCYLVNMPYNRMVKDGKGIRRELKEEKGVIRAKSAKDAFSKLLRR